MQYTLEVYGHKNILHRASCRAFSGQIFQLGDYESSTEAYASAIDRGFIRAYLRVSGPFRALTSVYSNRTAMLLTATEMYSYNIHY